MGRKMVWVPAFWLNRLINPGKELDAIPEGIGNSMTELLKFIDHQL
jgi:hypothetical protein